MGSCFISFCLFVSFFQSMFLVGVYHNNSMNVTGVFLMSLLELILSPDLESASPAFAPGVPWIGLNHGAKLSLRTLVQYTEEAPGTSVP